MYPHFRKKDVLAFKVSRVRQVFPLPVLNYSRDLPAAKTSVDGVYVINSSHIVNGTLNVNETVNLAERFFEEIFTAKARATQSNYSFVFLVSLWLITHETNCERFARPRQSMVLHEDARRCGLGSLPVISRYCRASGACISEGARSKDHVLHCRTGCRGLRRITKRLASIAEAGHEIGNHSFNHEPWLHLYSKPELIEEFEKTETAILDATGTRPTGFRGPGYSLSPTVLEVLAERGYKYDCSTLPTYIGPLARAYYFFKSPEMSDEERAKRKKLFGKFADGLQSIKPYIWDIGGTELVEIPVTTMPIVKFPVHASYIIYLSTFSRPLARIYWRMTVEMCRLTNTQPSLLLHPLDFLSGTDVAELRFFPGMNLPAAEKRSIVGDMLDTLSSRFDLVNLDQHANYVRKEKGSIRRSLTPTKMAMGSAQPEQLMKSRAL